MNEPGSIEGKPVPSEQIGHRIRELVIIALVLTQGQRDRNRFSHPTELSSRRAAGASQKANTASSGSSIGASLLASERMHARSELIADSRLSKQEISQLISQF